MVTLSVVSPPADTDTPDIDLLAKPKDLTNTV